MPVQIINKPFEAGHFTQTVEPGDSLNFTFDPSSASFARSGVDLVVSFENGGQILLDGFFAQGEGKELPSLQLPDGSIVEGSSFLAALNPDMDLTTAAGPVSATPSTGLNEYQEGAGNLLDGVSKLEALDAPLGTASAQETAFMDMLGGQSFRLETAGTPGGITPGGETPGTPGGIIPGPSSPDGETPDPDPQPDPKPPYDPNTYSQRAVLLLTEGSSIEMKIPMDPANSGFGLADIKVNYLGGSLEGVLEFKPVEIDGGCFLQISLDPSSLNEDMLQMLKDGVLLDYLEIQIGDEVHYNLQLIASQGESFDSRNLDEDADAGMSPVPGLTEYYGGSSRSYENYEIISNADTIYINQGLSHATIQAPDSMLHITGTDGKAIQTSYNRDPSDSQISGKEVYIHASDDRVISSKQNLTVEASEGIWVSGENNSSGSFYGVKARYGNFQTTLESDTGGIHLDFSSSGGSKSHGIYTDDATSTLLVKEKGDISINMSGGASQEVSGVYLDAGSGKLYMETAEGNIDITASTNGALANPNTSQIAYGLYARQGAESELISGKGDISIGVEVTGASSAGNNVFEGGSGVFSSNKASNTITADDGSIEITASSDSRHAFGVYSHGAYNTLTASDNITISAKGKAEAIGLHAKPFDETGDYGNFLTAGKNISITSHSSNYHAHGVKTYNGGTNTLESNTIEINAATESDTHNTYGIYTGYFSTDVLGKNPIQTDITLTGENNSLTISAEGGKNNYAMYTSTCGSNIIKGEEGGNTGITVTIIAKGGDTNYAMYADFPGAGKNIIEGNSIQGSRDVVDIAGDFYGRYAGCNSITTGAGNDHISLYGAMSSATVLSLDAGLGVDVLTLQADHAQDFTSKYKAWLGELFSGEHGHGVEVIHISGANIGGETMPWLQELVNQFNANHTDTPIALVDDTILADIIDGYDGTLGTGDAYHANLDAIVKWYEDEYSPNYGADTGAAAEEQASGGTDGLEVLASALVAYDTDDRLEASQDLANQGHVVDTASLDVTYSNSVNDTMYLDNFAEKFSLGELGDLLGHDMNGISVLDLAGTQANTVDIDSLLGDMGTLTINGNTEDSISLSSDWQKETSGAETGYTAYTNGETTLNIQDEVTVELAILAVTGG